MKYEVEVLKVGEFVPDMLENGDMVIFDDCPNDTLADLCYMHTRCEITAPIEVGDTVLVGTKSYRITAIGEEALHTLQELGIVLSNLMACQRWNFPDRSVWTVKKCLIY